MATKKPTNLQPVCQVPGCNEGASIQFLQGNVATWMRTCKKHTYQDLLAEQEKIETFWPPINK
jgi:hypothetical protein